MHKIRGKLLLSCLIVLGLIVAGCGLSTTPKEPIPIDDLDPLLADDFSGNEVGALPIGWSANEATRNASTIEVIEDAAMDSGYALRFKTTTTDPAFTASLSQNFASGAAASLANTISIDFAVKWVDGGSINFNVLSGNSYVVNLYINSDGTFGYRWTNEENRSVNEDIQVLDKDVWYQVRAVANLQTKKVNVYVDDMDTPALSDVPFRHAWHTFEGTWEGARVAISHTTNASAGEAIYGDLKITAVD